MALTKIMLEMFYEDGKTNYPGITVFGQDSQPEEVRPLFAEAYKQVTGEELQDEKISKIPWSTSNLVYSLDQENIPLTERKSILRQTASILQEQYPEAIFEDSFHLAGLDYLNKLFIMEE